MHEQVDLVAAALAGEQDGLEQVLVGRDGDRVAFVVEVAQRVAAREGAVLDDGGAADGVDLGAELGRDVLDELGHAVRGGHLQPVDAAAGRLELEGEGDLGR